jgi:CubicO group peptidase (beta-lactamase class C family)
MRALTLAAVLLAAGALPGASQPAGGPRDPAELEAFVDGLLPGLLAAHRVPGAVFVAVRDGRVLLQKGYGLADVARRRPVDPERTLFRVASVSKLVTASAALQLVEQGKLDLHADVNGLLRGFRLEPDFEEPVTLAHLLTHTGGFDDRFQRSAAPVGAPVPPLGEYLAARMPPRVMPPGLLISYSNHGLALVGHLVELASGLPFETYIERHLFEPLGMRSSRFGVPSPPPAALAVSYAWRDGEQVPMGLDRMRMAPAGDLVTTASDMARFMIAHLGLGAFEGVRILREETARRMQARQFSHHPELDGWCYGFAEGRWNGVRTVGHDGDWRGFRSHLVLAPEAGLGVFLSLNGAFEGDLFGSFDRAFADHYFPQPAEARPEPPPDFAERAGRYTGTYIPNRRERNSFFKLGLFLSTVRVTAREGALVAQGPGPTRRLVEVGPDLFREVDGPGRAVFLTDPDGSVRHLAYGAWAFDKVPPWHSPFVHRAVLGALFVLFVATLAGWALGAGARRLAGAAPSPVALPARLVGSAVCLLDAGFLAATAWLLRTADPFELMIEVPLSMRLVLAVPLLSALPTLALAVLAMTGVRAGAPLARLHYAGLALGSWLLLGLAAYWNLVGLRF